MFNRMLAAALFVLCISGVSCAADGNRPTSGDTAKPVIPGDMLSALQSGDCDTVNKLAATVPDVNARDERGGSVLMLAILAGCDDASRELAGRGADVDAANDVGERPANAAAVKGSVPMLKLLHERGADMTFMTKEGITLLYYATLGGDMQTAELIIGYAKDEFAAQGLSDEDVSSKMAEYVNTPAPDGNTSLMNAVFAGNLDMCKLLVGQGADIYAENQRGVTALGVAMRFDQYDIEKYLREIGPLFLK